MPSKEPSSSPSVSIIPSNVPSVTNEPSSPLIPEILVAIGAHGNDGVNGIDSGHVRVYGLIGGAWTQIGSDIDGEAAGDGSGYSVSLSADGSIVAIGAHLNDGNDGTDSRRGHVRVYQLIDGDWTQLGGDIDGEVMDISGWSVSLSSDGSTVAIGAFKFDSNRGRVRIYKLIGGVWTQAGSNIDGEYVSDYSGWSVSLSGGGSIVAIGAYLNDDGGYSSGHVRVYKLIGSTWTQVGSDINGEDDSDLSGGSVSLSDDGSIVAIGATGNDGIDGTDTSRGHVRVYGFTGGAWTQIGSDIDGEAAGDRSGHSVSLSGDGSSVAISSTVNDGVNGIDSGHVRVYKLIGSVWTQVGDDIDGEAAGDGSGGSVSLSDDGSIVAIGAAGNDGIDGTDSNRGHVRVYQLIGDVWTQIGSDLDGEAAADASGWSVSLAVP